MIKAYAKYLVAIILLTFALHSCDDGCGGDCVNGTCVEEACLCDPGYEGQSCDIMAEDFSGFYFGSSLSFSECDNATFNETRFADSQLRFCESRGDDRYCKQLFLEIGNNNNYVLTIADIFSTPGTEEFVIPDTQEGSYTTDGDTIVMCATDNNACHTMVRATDGNRLTWRREDPTCVSTYVLIKI